MKSKYSVLFLVFFLLTSCVSLAQKKGKKYQTKSKAAIKLFEEGLKFYRLLYIKDAVSNLNQAVEKDPTFPDPYIVLGDIYYQSRKYAESEKNFLKAIEVIKKKEKALYFSLAETQLAMLSLDKAIASIDEFLAFENLSVLSKKRGENLKEIALYRKGLVSNPVEFKPINLGGKINGANIEHSPTLTVDEEIIYFTRKEPSGIHHRNSRRKMNEDLYLGKKDAQGNWSKALNLGKSINTAGNEGAACISPDGKYLFFTSCDRPNGVGSCDLYLAARRGDYWVNPRNLGAALNSPAWESQPSFSSDGRTLYFVSNRRGGKGGKDIWVSKIGDDGRWSKPKSVSINTNGNEESPFIHPDGHTFYFASDGLPGMGMRDLYFVKVDDDGNFGEPKNLGYPINSGLDEVSLSVSADGKTAYYASEMEGGFGKWDLYKFNLPEKVQPEPVTYSKGKVYDAESNEPLRVKFEIIDVETGKRVIESYSDPETGEFLVTVPLNKDYALNASKKGYLFYSESFSVKGGGKAYAFNVGMKPMKEGQSVVLKNIFFETDKYDLKPTSQAELNKLVDLLNENPEMKIEIGGHTDNVGSKDYNQKLSENRAKSVFEYLIQKGITKERLSYKGYNFEQPVTTNDTPEGRAQNRRTEFKVIGL